MRCSELRVPVRITPRFMCCFTKVKADRMASTGLESELAMTLPIASGRLTIGRTSLSSARALMSDKAVAGRQPDRGPGAFLAA